MARSVFITGASSGLGEAMAREFAARGYQLVLTARRLELLQQLAQSLRKEFGVRVEVMPLDVTDQAAVSACLKQALQLLGRLDIVIANAGIGITMQIGKASFDDIKAMIEANVLGLMATVEGALPLLRAQGHGQLVGISSVAACRGLPGGGAYGASKAAVMTYLQSLQVETAAEPIDITILSPGYIDTPMNRGAASRPFVIGAEVGARKLVDRVEQKVAHAYVPAWPWRLLAPLLKCLPTGVIAKAL